MSVNLSNGVTLHTLQICFGRDSFLPISFSGFLDMSAGNVFDQVGLLFGFILGETTLWTLRMGVVEYTTGWEHKDRIAGLVPYARDAVGWAWGCLTRWSEMGTISSNRCGFELALLSWLAQLAVWGAWIRTECTLFPWAVRPRVLLRMRGKAGVAWSVQVSLYRGFYV